MTSAACNRGTSWEGVYYANHPNHKRNYYCINSLPGYENHYSKPQSRTDRVRQTFYCPAFQVTRLQLFLFACVYPAAAHISLFLGTSKELADNYLYMPFVKFGKPMVSDDFGKYLAAITYSTLGISIGLRDYRQLDNALLLKYAEIDPEKLDNEAEVLEGIHEAYDHSSAIGKTNYGLLTHGSTDHLSPGDISFLQRLAIRWHGVIGLVHPELAAKAQSLSVGHFN